MNLLKCMKMMFKRMSLLIAVFIVGVSSNLSAQDPLIKDTTEEASEDFGVTLPSLKIQISDTVFLTNEDFKTEGHLFLITINPTCGDCNSLGALINRNAELFKQSKVVFMMTPQIAPNLEFFTNSTHVRDNPELIVGVDRNGTIDQMDDEEYLPYVNIYKDGKLVQKMNGALSLDELKKFLP